MAKIGIQVLLMLIDWIRDPMPTTEECKFQAPDGEKQHAVQETMYVLLAAILDYEVTEPNVKQE